VPGSVLSCAREKAIERHKAKPISVPAFFFLANRHWQKDFRHVKQFETNKKISWTQTVWICKDPEKLQVIAGLEMTSWRVHDFD
jgi:hypothetical protein